jgi:hypothetical protein
MGIVDKIRQNCILGADATNVVTEVEQNKCVSSLDEVTEIIHPINREDDELPPLPPVININDGSVALPHETRPICDFDGPCALPFQMIRYPR